MNYPAFQENKKFMVFRDKTVIATGIGFCATLLWALLAWLTAASGMIPPFALVGMTFAIAFLLWLARAGYLVVRHGWQWLGFLRQSWRVWGLVVGGLFLYHAVYFAALRHAPPIEASLIAYLWPLLIVLFSGFLPGEKLTPTHIIGAVIGFLGASQIILNDRGLSFNSAHLFGYGLALLCAVIWSSYSILSRLVGSVPSDFVGPCCGITAALGWITHVFVETSIPAFSWSEGLSVLALGIGPVGLAFFLWDIGVKRGDIKILGVLSYFSPLFSSFVLILTGHAMASRKIAISAILITLGAAIAGQVFNFSRATRFIKRLNR